LRDCDCWGEESACRWAIVLTQCCALVKEEDSVRISLPMLCAVSMHDVRASLGRFWGNLPSFKDAQLTGSRHKKRCLSSCAITRLKPFKALHRSCHTASGITPDIRNLSLFAPLPHLLSSSSSVHLACCPFLQACAVRSQMPEGAGGGGGLLDKLARFSAGLTLRTPHSFLPGASAFDLVLRTQRCDEHSPTPCA
jgi:hypothetical protein